MKRKIKQPPPFARLLYQSGMVVHTSPRILSPPCRFHFQSHGFLAPPVSRDSNSIESIDLPYLQLQQLSALLAVVDGVALLVGCFAAVVDDKCFEQEMIWLATNRLPALEVVRCWRIGFWSFPIHGIFPQQCAHPL
jgi:hypothetical protein